LAACSWGVCFAATPSDSKRLGDILVEAGIEAPPYAEAVVTKNLRREGRSHRFWTVFATLARKTVRFEISTNIGPAAAGRIVDERSVVVRGLYRPATMDYFGVMSGRSVVPDGLQPEVLYPEKGLLHSGNPAFILWSRKDLSYAVHERGEGVNRGLLAFRYCEAARTLLEVETFEPAAEFDKAAALREFSALKCAAPAAHQ
jgi:hypothetical protein